MKIFISYRRDDSSYIAGIIYERLAQQFGAGSIFFDIDSIPLGTDFRKRISDSVGNCNVLLAIIGDSWVNAVGNQGGRRLDDPADFVRLEIESALVRDIPVIPVLVGKARMPTTTELPSSLQDLAFRNATEVRAGHDLQQHLARLVKGIDLISKGDQTALEPQQSSNSESISETASMKATIASTVAPPENGKQQTQWERWVFSLIILIIFAFAGIEVGNLISYLASGTAALIGAVSTLVLGVFLAYKVWKRFSRA